MDLNFILVRQISILSTFLGAVLAVLTLVPFIGTISFLFLICFVAPVVIWILLKYDCITMSSVKDGIIAGAIAGFVSYIVFSAVFIPVSIILIKLFNYSPNYGIGIMLNNASFFILAVVSVFMGVVGATVNAFTGFLTFYAVELLGSLKK